MISLKQLNYALAVEKHLHFKKAAEQCFVSQSTLSTALMELEAKLGGQIFERDNRKVLITSFGKEVLTVAKRIIEEVDELEHLSERQQGILSYPISLGIIPTIAPFLLPEVLPIINEKYPNADLKVLEEQSHVLVEKVRNGEIDTAVLALPYSCEGLLTMEFWEEDFYWVTREEQAAFSKGVTSEDLTERKLMLLSEGHCLKDHVLNACKFTSSSTNQSLSATSLNTLIQMVIGELGSTLIPEMALDSLTSQHRDLKAFHLAEPGPHRRIAFILRPTYVHMNTIQELMALCEQALNNIRKR